MTAKTLFFAYGSNMLTRRMKSRCPSASFHGITELKERVLRWHKLSQDGSGKCDAFATWNPDDSIWGIVYEIDDVDLPGLDRAEGYGSGYDRELVALKIDKPESPTYLYYATKVDDTLKPYSWYKDIVLAGAREHRLPDAYISQIESVEALEDPDRRRDQRERLILSDNG